LIETLLINLIDKMKIIRILIVSVLVVFVFYFAFRKSEISIEGEWDLESLVLNGDKYVPTYLDRFLTSQSEVIIDSWSDTIQISKGVEKINAHYKIVKKVNDDYIVKLSSSEKSLNGNFIMEIDTIHIGAMSYRVHVKLQSKKTKLYFKRVRNIGPWKPEFPRKGKV